MVAHVKPNGWGDTFTPRMAADLRTLFANGITFRDNMNIAIVTFDAQHGAETLVANPLSGKPIAFIPSESFSITAIGGKSNQVARPIDGDPVLNTSRADGMLGITVRFAAPVGVCAAYRSAAYNFPDNTSTRVPLDTAIFEDGDLSFDAANESIVCARPGFIYATYQIEFSGSAAGTSRRAFVYKNNTPAAPVEVWGLASLTPNAVNNRMSGSGLISVSAGDLLRIAAYQNSGGVLAIGVDLFKTKLDAHYVAPPAACLGRVSGILVGG